MKVRELLLLEKINKIIPDNASLEYAVKLAEKEAKANGKKFDADDPDDRLKALIPMLQHNCKTIVDAYKKNKGGSFLYRGISKSAMEFASKILDKREPGYLHKETHDLANTAMTKMGLTAHRGNSAFCSTNVDIADDWGSNVYIIFPKDGFTFTTFTGVEDGTYLFDALDKFKYRKETESQKINRMVKLLKSLDPQSENISKWLPLSHEYMIAGEGFIALNKNFYEVAVDNWMNGRNEYETI